MAITFTLAISLYLLFRVLQQLHGVWQSEKFLTAPLKSYQEKENRVAIIIPIYCEDKHLPEALEFWKESNLSPIFITTEREMEAGCNSLKIVKDLSNFQVINSPNLSGYKAVQLNYAISQLEDIDYIAIFDIDSRPDLKVFEYIERYGTANIYQMPTKFISNYSTNSIYGKGSAIYQSRRVLSFEIPSLLNGDFTYLVGHGLFVKKEIFSKFRFNEETITEDLIFGYELYLSDYRAEPLPFFDSATVPSEFIKTVKQTSRWFAGDLIFLKYIELTWTSSIKILQRYLHILDWLWGSIGFYIVIFFGDSVEILIVLLSLLIFLHIHKRVGNILKVKPNYFPILYRASTNSFAPIYGIYRLLLQALKLKSFLFERTEK